MTCADARHIILSADHRVLRETADPMLREHLESCAHCAAGMATSIAWNSDIGSLPGSASRAKAPMISPQMASEMR